MIILITGLKCKLYTTADARVEILPECLKFTFLTKSNVAIDVNTSNVMVALALGNMLV